MRKDKALRAFIVVILVTIISMPLFCNMGCKVSAVDVNPVSEDETHQDSSICLNVLSVHH